jgi:hypothetical protein
LTLPDRIQAINYVSAGLNEVLGDSREALNSTLPLEVKNRVETSLDSRGENFTRGMLIRVGRASLYYWIRDNGERFGWNSMDFKLLSFRYKLLRGIEDLTTWWSQSGAGNFTIDSNAKTVVVEYQPGEQVITQLGCCFFMGLIQEYISWLASGKFFPAREIQCLKSDSQRHVFEISKTPLD